MPGMTALDRPTRPLTIALRNDFQIVTLGMERMLADYRGRVEIVELNANTSGTRDVDITLYDTFSQSQVTGADIDELLDNPASGVVVVFTWNMERELIEAARGKGAGGYLSKSLPGEQLVRSLERIAAGEFVVEPLSDLDVVPEVRAGDWPGRKEGLTAREAEVISLIVQGLSNNEIADKAYLSLNSVKAYIKAAYRKMGVTSRSQAVLWGLDHGLHPDRMRTVRK